MKITSKRTNRLIIFMLCSISLLSTHVVTYASENEGAEVIMLWPKDTASEDNEGMGTPKPINGDGYLRIRNVSKPSLEYFPTTVGGQPVPAVILSPGGGYGSLNLTKMTMIAEWLNKRGIAAFLLKYHVPEKKGDPKMQEEAFQDIQRAVRIVRSRASKWNLDPSRIGVLGSSAGGHLSARASAGYDIQAYDKVDTIDDLSCKPDFTVLLYPAYMNRGKGRTLSEEFTVSNEISPTLIISAKDDKAHFPGSPVYAKALEEVGASVRVHFFEKGGHGFTVEAEEYPLSTWPDLLWQWLKDMEIAN